MNSEVTPPPLPVYAPAAVADGGALKNRHSVAGKAFSVASVVIGCAGILPLLLFFFSAMGARDWAGRSDLNLGHLIFFFLGLLVHGLGLGAGITGTILGSRIPGILGMVGNAAIMVLAILTLFISLAL
jgi:hypothetical protein